MLSFEGRDILSLKEFERQEFFHVFDVAAELEPIAVNRRNSDLLAEKTLVTAFYQPSTRTRLAHEAAALAVALAGRARGERVAARRRADAVVADVVRAVAVGGVVGDSQSSLGTARLEEQDLGGFPADLHQGAGSGRDGGRGRGEGAKLLLFR